MRVAGRVFRAVKADGAEEMSAAIRAKKPLIAFPVEADPEKADSIQNRIGQEGAESRSDGQTVCVPVALHETETGIFRLADRELAKQYYACVTNGYVLLYFGSEPFSWRTTIECNGTILLGRANVSGDIHRRSYP